MTKGVLSGKGFERMVFMLRSESLEGSLRVNIWKKEQSEFEFRIPRVQPTADADPVHVEGSL